MVIYRPISTPLLTYHTQTAVSTSDRDFIAIPDLESLVLSQDSRIVDIKKLILRHMTAAMTAAVKKL